ncbi:MAG: hypothetical protein GY941_24395 [Planctomycetes bacterium]|nr:hypothetical protein [Planctomycetota bacterium]
MEKKWKTYSSKPNRAQLVHERELKQIGYSAPSVKKTAWWVVASEHEDPNKKSWHWDWYFENPDGWEGWGGPDWITSTHSHKLVELMNEGDIVVAYQAYEKEIVGLTYLDSPGYEGPTGNYDLFDLKAEPIIWFEPHKRVPYSAIRALSQARQEIQFCSDHVVRQGTVFEITPAGFDLILSVLVRHNATTLDEIKKFLKG